MKVKVDIKVGKVRALTEASKKAIPMVAEQLRTELVQSQTMPFDEGILQNVQTYIDMKAVRQGRVLIVHDTPYAKRLYFHPEYNFSTDTNANARGEWWEPYLTGEKQKVPQQLFKKFYKKLAGV